MCVTIAQTNILIHMLINLYVKVIKSVNAARTHYDMMINNGMMNNLILHWTEQWKNEYRSDIELAESVYIFSPQFCVHVVYILGEVSVQ